MSLEAALEANTAAVERHTEALEKFIALGAAAAGKAPAKGAASKPAAAGKKGGTSKKKNPWDSEDDFLAYCTAYLKSSDDKAEKKLAAAAIKPVLDHFGVSRFSEIEADNWEECCGYLAKLSEAIKADGFEDLGSVDLGLSNEDEDGDEDGDDDMI